MKGFDLFLTHGLATLLKRKQQKLASNSTVFKPKFVTNHCKLWFSFHEWYQPEMLAKNPCQLVYNSFLRSKSHLEIHVPILGDLDFFSHLLG
jgi:hypothetical protein